MASYSKWTETHLKKLNLLLELKLPKMAFKLNKKSVKKTIEGLRCKHRWFLLETTDHQNIS